MRKTAKDYAEYIGRKYGEWTVLEYAGKSPSNHAYFKCRCSCGKVVRVKLYSIQTGRSVACKGHICKNWPDGMTKSRYNSVALRDNYVRQQLRQRTSLKPTDIPQSLVEAKRAQLMLMRALKGK